MSKQSESKYILLDILVSTIAEYLYELCRIFSSLWDPSK